MALDIMYNLNYWISAQKIKWSSFLVYRFQALVWLIYSALFVVYTYVTINIIYGVSTGISGWSYYQLLALGATANIAVGIVIYVIGNTNIVWYLRQGQIDTYITKPYGLLTIFLSNFGSTDSIATIVGGLVLLTYATSHIQIGTLAAVGYAIMFLFGTFAFLMFMLMLIIVSYHFFRSGVFVWRMVNLVTTLSKYPLTVYGLAGEIFFTILIPIGLAYFYPSNLLFGSLGIGAFFFTIAVSIGIALFCYFVFRKFIREYTSGGG